MEINIILSFSEALENDNVIAYLNNTDNRVKQQLDYNMKMLLLYQFVDADFIRVHDIDYRFIDFSHKEYQIIIFIKDNLNDYNYYDDECKQRLDNFFSGHYSNHYTQLESNNLASFYYMRSNNIAYRAQNPKSVYSIFQFLH